MAGPDDPQRKRVERIISELLPHVTKWNDRAKDWHWETMVIKSRTINAFCMPGGKIAVFNGLLERLQLSDDEATMVIGHEMAHALREHSRARAAKATLTTMGASAVALLIGGNVGQIARVGGGLLTLRFSRNDEKEADLIGMELAARAGHDPRAGLTLWEKMSNAAKGTPPQWLSTHPSGATRVELIKDNLKYVLPLYERAQRANLRRQIDHAFKARSPQTLARLPILQPRHDRRACALSSLTAARQKRCALAMHGRQATA